MPPDDERDGEHDRRDAVEQEHRTDGVDVPVAVAVQLQVDEPAAEHGERGHHPDGQPQGIGRRAHRQPCTVIVPVMKLWIPHLYG